MAIKQTVTIKTSAKNVYKTLMTGKRFSEMTGAPAKISKDEGGQFSCFGGQVTGRHIALTPNKQIVQAWRVGPWPDATYSIVKFDIEESGGSTKVGLEHNGFPDGAAADLESGWQKMYWAPMKAYLE